jgi:Phosphotransferase enzyme family
MTLGAGLRALHRLPVNDVRLRTHPLRRELKEVLSASEPIYALAPDLGILVTSILVQARHLSRSIPAMPPMFAYGDFKCDHLFASEHGLTLIDPDGCCLAEPALDVGKFLADLSFWYDADDLHGLEEAQAAFLEGYEIDGNRTDLDRSRLYAALVLVRLTARRVMLSDPDWELRTQRLLIKAKSVLDDLSTKYPLTTGTKPPALSPL